MNEKGRLGVRAIQYSNAGIRQPNEGIESYALCLALQYLSETPSLHPTLPALLTRLKFDFR
ncbi:MAG: acyloxyacyl hydrolase [Pseudomonas sp.]